MRYLAAFLLLGLGGNSDPSASDIKNLLATVGIEAEDERLNSLLKEVKGKDINELIKKGSEKLASVPSVGASAAPATVASTGGAAMEEKEEKKEEAQEESDEDMGFSLFD